MKRQDEHYDGQEIPIAKLTDAPSSECVFRCESTKPEYIVISLKQQQSSNSTMLYYVSAETLQQT